MAIQYLTGVDTAVNAWTLNIEDTESGPITATFLAILAAILHEVFATLQKARHDPWLSRRALDFYYMMIALPFALYVLPWLKQNYHKFSPVFLSFT